MEIIKTWEFDKALTKLPADVKRLYIKQEHIFRRDWRDSRLHVKKMKGLGLAFSFRITRRYRVLFYFQNPNRAIFFDVDHRKEIYR